MGSKKINRPRILLVDDDQMLVTLFHDYLIANGYEVMACINAEMALENFQRDVRYFDILVTDYQMPGMSGAELCSQLMLLRQDMPLIVVSGDVDEFRKNLLMRIGVTRVLAKPIKLVSLVTEIAHALGDTFGN